MASHSRYHLNLSGQIARQERHADWFPDFTPTSRRIRGHDGSSRLPSVGEQRELEMIATGLLHCSPAELPTALVAANSGVCFHRDEAVKQHRDEKSNRIGFGGVSEHYLAQNRSDRAPLPRAVSLRDVVASIDADRAESVSLAESVAVALNNLSEGFGSYLLDVENVVIAAKLAGISKSAGYRHVETVRNSWENFAVSAG